MKNKLIYICSPYRNNPEKNTEIAKEHSRYVYEQGHIPFAPQLAAKFFEDADEEAMVYCIKILDKMDEIWVFGRRITPGMREEIEWWEENKKNKVVYK